MDDAKTNETPFSTVAMFCKRHPAFTVGGLRHLIFNDPAGVRAACVVRFGRRLLIDEVAFFAWLRANRERSNLFGPDSKPKTTPAGRATTHARRKVAA